MQYLIKAKNVTNTEVLKIPLLECLYQKSLTQSDF